MGFGAGLRLGQAEGADQLATGQPRQVAFLLRIGAIVQDRAAADRVVDAHQRGAGGAARGDFFDGERVRDIVGVGAAPVLRHDHAEQAQRAHFGDNLFRQAAVAVPLGGAGGQALAGKGARAVADHLLLFGVVAVHGRLAWWCSAGGFL
ncbi:hypothetical protein D3C81_1457090 [compost metagenome]